MAAVEIDKAIFNDVYLPYLNEMARTQIFYGGSASGKSVFVCQRAVYDVMRGGRNYLMCRQVARTINRSIFNEIVKVITDWGVQSLFTVNKSDFTITCANLFQILFVGLDDVEKLKSITPKRGAITDVVVDEATETDRATVKQLFKRQRGGDPATPKRLTLSFNPILKSHWIYKDYFGTINLTDTQTEYRSPALSILKTTYRDNRFLTDADRADLENETDPYYKAVYTDGAWGVLGNVIFKNWRVEDLSVMLEEFTNARNGLDFGFSSDPAAVVKTHYDTKHKTIYVYGEVYERGLTNDLLAVEVKKLVGAGYVVCDSSEPKSIAELQGGGVSAGAAKKGKDSVDFGIQWLQQQTIVIDTACINAKNEFEGYHWREDKDGNALRQPVDKNNHLIDALRYAYESESGGAWEWE